MAVAWAASDIWSASRGTVRQAVATLAAEGLIGSRQGARRIVLRQERKHSFSELNSFAQWAEGLGHEVSSRFLSRVRRPATAEEAERLAVAPGAEVLAVLRLRRLDGEPVMVERTAYADCVAAAVEAMAEDCRSVMDGLARDWGWSPSTASTSSTRFRRAVRTRGCWNCGAAARCCGNVTSRPPAPAARSSGPTTATVRAASPSA